MSLRLLSFTCLAFATAWHPLTTTAQENQPTLAPKPMAAIETEAAAEVEAVVVPATEEDTAPVAGVDDTKVIEGEELDTSKGEEIVEPTPLVPESNPVDATEIVEKAEETSVLPSVTEAPTVTGGSGGLVETTSNLVQGESGALSGSYDGGYVDAGASYDGISYGDATGAPLATYYAPQYYGYYGNFYSTRVNFGGFRGWSMWRMWTPALNTAGLAPTAYPHFYAAHYAAYPHLYYNPYRYYPTYYYPAASFGSSYYYSVQPESSVIITQPYMPLLGDAKSSTPATNAAPAAINVNSLVAAIQKAEPQAKPVVTSEIKLVTARTTIATKAGRSVSREEEAAAFSDVYHAYWRGDNKDAMQQVQTAIQAAPQSARAWYYKGMIEMRMDEKEKAVDSLAQAVKLHMDNPSQNADVNYALERVQGRIRVQLHRARLKAESARRNQNK